MLIDVWLYGPLARYGGEAHEPGYAHLELEVAEGSKMRDLLAQLGISDDERGITFINGALAAMPGVPADHDVLLNDGDRVALFHPNSMWPFQYRLGAGTTPQLQQALQKREYRVLPPTAYEMYFPEVMGRGDGMLFTITR